MNILDKNVSSLDSLKTSTPKALAIASVIGLVAFTFGKRVMKKGTLSSALQASAVAGAVLNALSEKKSLQESF